MLLMLTPESHEIRQFQGLRKRGVIIASRFIRIGRILRNLERPHQHDKIFSGL